MDYTPVQIGRHQTRESFRMKKVHEQLPALLESERPAKSHSTGCLITASTQLERPGQQEPQRFLTAAAATRNPAVGDAPAHLKNDGKD